MMEILKKLTALAFLVTLGCGGGDDGEGNGETPAELSECCKSAMALVEQMPECCRTGISVVGSLSGCCEKGMLDDTPDADRPDCCKKGKALMDQFEACCKETVLTGEPGECCKEMPAALLAQATKK